MASYQNPHNQVIQPGHSNIYSMTSYSDISPRTSVVMTQGSSSDDRRPFTSRPPLESARGIDGSTFRDVNWTEGRLAESCNPARSTSLETTHKRQKPKKLVNGLCLLRTKAPTGRKMSERMKGRKDTATSSGDAQPQCAPQPATTPEQYSTLIRNGPYGERMQTDVTTTDHDDSSLNYYGYDLEAEYDLDSDYDSTSSDDDEESDDMDSDQDHADQASTVYPINEYARTEEINNAFGDGRYVLSPDGVLVARRDLGPLDALHARAAQAWRRAKAKREAKRANAAPTWFRTRTVAITEESSGGRAARKAEAAGTGCVSDGINGMTRAVKRMLEKSGRRRAKSAPGLTSNENEEDEPAVDMVIHEVAEGPREYEQRVLAGCCMNHRESERRNTV